MCRGHRAQNSKTEFMKFIVGVFGGWDKYSECRLYCSRNIFGNVSVISQFNAILNTVGTCRMQV